MRNSAKLTKPRNSLIPIGKTRETWTSRGRRGTAAPPQSIGVRSTACGTSGHHAVRRVGYNMSKRINTAATIAICLLGLARSSSAQDDSTKFRPFGGFFADMFSDDTSQQQHKVQRTPNPNYSVPNYSTAGGRSPSTSAQGLSPTPAPPPLAEPPSDVVPKPDYNVNNRAGTTDSARTVTNDNYSFQWNGAAAANPPCASPLGRKHFERRAQPQRPADVRAPEAVPRLAVRRRARLAHCDARSAGNGETGSAGQQPNLGGQSRTQRCAGPAAVAGWTAFGTAGRRGATARSRPASGCPAAAACRRRSRRGGPAGSERADRPQEPAAQRGNDRAAEDRGRQGSGLRGPTAKLRRTGGRGSRRHRRPARLGGRGRRLGEHRRDRRGGRRPQRPLSLDAAADRGPFQGKADA